MYNGNDHGGSGSATQAKPEPERPDKPEVIPVEPEPRSEADKQQPHSATTGS